MIEKGDRIYSEGEYYTVIAAWELDYFQKDLNPGAKYGYEIESDKGAVRVVVDTQLER